MPTQRRARENDDIPAQNTPANSAAADPKKVNLTLARQYLQDASQNRHLMAMSNIVSQLGIDEAARANGYQLPETTFSHRIKPKIPLMDQQQAGLCWMYAGCGVLLHHAQITNGYKSKLNPLSIAYWAFWQTYERTNLWLNEIIARIELPYDSLEMLHYLRDCINDYSTADGATASTFQALVTKYGAIPAQVMPLSLATISSGDYSAAVQNQLQEIFCDMRRTYNQLTKNKVPTDQIKDQLMQKKAAYLRDIFNILVVHFGKPIFPDEQFSYNYRLKYDDASDSDIEEQNASEKEVKAANARKKPKFTAEKVAGDAAESAPRPPVLNLNYAKFTGTPREFATKLLAHEGAEYVQLCTNDAPGFAKKRKYRDPMFEGAVDGLPYEYYNVGWDELCKSIIRSINANEAVELSAQIREFDHTRGVAGHNHINHQQLYQTTVTATRAERQACYNIVAEHAMQIVAYHDPFGTGKPTRFRIQNSWGEETTEPYITADAEWMQQYCTGVMVRKEFVSKALLNAADAKPVIEVKRDDYHIARPRRQ